MANDLRGRKVEYWKYSFDRRFVARQEGRYEFGPVSVKGSFGNRINGRDLDTELAYLVIPPLAITVSEPPKEGRPMAYVGAIGQFECGAALSPSEARVGDPMTLTIWLRGSGTLDRAVAPQLNEIPAISQAFKVYDATEETNDDVRKFTYSLRPKLAEIDSFPAVEMAYFDVNREQYVTLNTEPIALDISAADHLQGSDIAMSGAQGPSAGRSIETRDEGIFANVTDLGSLQDERVRPDRWFVGLGGMAGLFLLIVAGKQQIERRSGDIGSSRRRKAAARVRQRLSALRAENSTTTQADALSNALVGLVADVTGVEEQGMTSADAADRLRALNVEVQLVDRYQALLSECDAIRYGSGTGTFDRLLESATGIVDELTATLRRMKYLP
jgi:hypothetical protein